MSLNHFLLMRSTSLPRQTIMYLYVLSDSSKTKVQIVLYIFMRAQSILTLFVSPSLFTLPVQGLSLLLFLCRISSLTRFLGCFCQCFVFALFSVQPHTHTNQNISLCGRNCLFVLSGEVNCHYVCVGPKVNKVSVCETRVCPFCECVCEPSELSCWSNGQQIQHYLPMT